MPTQAYIDRTIDQAMAYFPNDHNIRIMHYARAATIDSFGNPLLSPRIITPLLKGHAGYGKTSKVREYAKKMDIGLIERKLGGITDIAEVFGMVDTDPEGQVTVLCKPAWWPDPEHNPNHCPEGIILWDDATRCLPHILQSIMQLWIDGEVNGLELPPGWTLVCTGNPEDGYNVTTMDSAQESRLLTIGYSRPNEVFFEQLELQGVDDDLKNVWMGTEETHVNPPELKLTKPADNDRLKMIFARVYDYLKHDDIALQAVAKSMFDPRFLVALNAMRKAEKPLRPEQILNEWSENQDKAQIYILNRRTDLVNISVTKLLTYLSTRDVDQVTNLNPDAYRHLAAFCTMLPSSEGQHFLTKLTERKDSRGIGHATDLKKACIAVNSPFVKVIAETMTKIEQKLKARRGA
jgi:hypothetical protein